MDNGSKLSQCRRNNTLLSPQNVLNQKFGFIADALNRLPDGTVIDGDLVALDASGRPNFNLLHFRLVESQIVDYAFDILVRTRL